MANPLEVPTAMPDSPDNEGSRAWDRARITQLETRLNQIEAPIRDAIHGIQQWQAGAIEREKRRDDGTIYVGQQVQEMRKSMDERLKKIEDSIPNKGVNDLVLRGIIGLGAIVLGSVVAAWMGLIGLKP